MTSASAATAPARARKSGGRKRSSPPVGVRFELISIERLRPHEETREPALRQVVRDLQREGKVREPILVADEHLVVLNGHHRLAALRALGVRKVPAWVVAYFTDIVELDKWPESSHLHPISKEEVVERAHRGKLYPPKTTRHRLKVELPERETPLSELR